MIENKYISDTDNCLTLQFTFENYQNEFTLYLDRLTASEYNAIAFPKDSVFTHPERDVSLAGWIWVNSLGDDATIFGEFSMSGNARNYFGITSEGHLIFEKEDFTEGSSAISSTTLITENCWTHVAIVERGNYALFYINGTLQESVGFTDPSFGLELQSINIGSTNVSGSCNYDRLDGKIDMLRLFNGTLTEPEVDWLFNYGRGQFISLERHYPEPRTFIPTEQYKIIDLATGQESEWTDFHSQSITQFSHLGDLPARFKLVYRLVDYAGNEITKSTYNGDQYDTISYEKNTTLNWQDDSIDLNSNIESERELVFDGDFGENSLTVYINGFRYGTATYDGSNYRLSFGTENNRSTMIAYSDSLLSPYAYSNFISRPSYQTSRLRQQPFIDDPGRRWTLLARKSRPAGRGGLFRV